MNHIARSSFLALLLLSSSLLALGCSSSDDGAADTPAADTQDVTSSRDITATTKEEHAALGSIWNVKRILNDRVSLFLYETGGGDPAMNGNLLYLGAFGEHGAGGVFDLGINIVEVKKAEMVDADTIKITGIRDTMGDDGGIKPGQPFEATVTFTVKDNGVDGLEVGKQVVVMQPGEIATTVTATNEARWSFMGLITSMTRLSHIDNQTVGARLFAQTGGDPAMNGVLPFLSINLDMEEKTFDLGLDLAGISRVSFKSSTELRIEALEDRLDADGIPHAHPVVYSVKYSIDGESVGDKIELTKVSR
jgi:hypothetical protein